MKLKDAFGYAILKAQFFLRTLKTLTVFISAKYISGKKARIVCFNVSPLILTATHFLFF
jgi:hypothetical protein